MSISDQIRHAASVDVFKLVDEKSAFVGHPFYFDYDYVHVLVADARKNRVGGIPQSGLK